DLFDVPKYLLMENEHAEAVVRAPYIEFDWRNEKPTLSTLANRVYDRDIDNFLRKHPELKIYDNHFTDAFLAEYPTYANNSGMKERIEAIANPRYEIRDKNQALADWKTIFSNVTLHENVAFPYVDASYLSKVSYFQLKGPIKK